MTAKSQELQYIESDPEVCGGQWVIKDTRIMIWIIRDQLRRGMTPESIVGEWRGKVILAAIEEVRHAEVVDPEIPIDLA